MRIICPEGTMNTSTLSERNVNPENLHKSLKNIGILLNP
jgi:hypothetical protein